MYAGDKLRPGNWPVLSVRSGGNDRISSLSLFFGLEINRIEDASLDAKYEQSEALGRYRPWLDENRAFRPHQLSDEVEQVLHERRVAGSAAWVPTV